MRKVIRNALEKCVGCNHCVRVCPIEEANIVRDDGGGKIIVEIDNIKCIACGACQSACHHGSRYYEDDSERFFTDLSNGEDICILAAPAFKTNCADWERMLTWLRELGVNKIYDVSLGADICTWAHVRHIQKNGPSPIISQPCPSVVNYVLMYRGELKKYLSPVHSPMLCTAVYMRKYDGITGKIAALSPCVAKTIEFEATGAVDYNVTIKGLSEYIELNRISLPENPSGFDHHAAGLGSIFPMPGGLKENIVRCLGKTLRIDRSEGQHTVYKLLDEYARQPREKLPALFDILNCEDGCNRGTGCSHDTSIFTINAMMDEIRQKNVNCETGRQHLDKLFTEFDERLNISDFFREYTPAPVKRITITHAQIEAAFTALGKLDEESRHHDCGACGRDRCTEMAEQIARGVNIVRNCAAYVNKELEHTAQESELAKSRAEAAHDELISGILYASKIQQHLLPRQEDLQKTFSDCSVIWNPSNIVGGDIYWMKRFDTGTILCVCDCTGHGTPGALLTMLAVSALEAVVWPGNCSDTSDIIWRFDQQLAEVIGIETEQKKCRIVDIKSGCDLAVLFIATNGDITLSSGKMDVFVCDGKDVERIKGQKISIGEGATSSRNDVHKMKIPYNPANKFYVASDGLFDQHGSGYDVPFGYQRFASIILENHAETQAVISKKVWEAFEAYRGSEPRVDDLLLVTFRI